MKVKSVMPNNKRVKDRAASAKYGFAKGGSAERSIRISEFMRNAGQIVAFSVVFCLVVVGIITLVAELSVMDSSKTSKKVKIYYGDTLVSTDRTLAYDNDTSRINMTILADMLSLTFLRDSSTVSFVTRSGDSMTFNIGESTVIVNDIRFSLAAKTCEDKGEIFVSSEVVDRFIPDASVVVSSENNTINIVTLDIDPDSVTFSPKKSPALDTIDRPSSIPPETSYHPIH